jgi:hypothetical protein
MDKIGTYHPDVLLLHIGVNDLDLTSPATSISRGVQGVQTLIAADLTHGGTPDLIVPFNANWCQPLTRTGITL